MKKRKPAEVREKDLLLAVSRIQRGRAHTNATTLSIAAVAREAGVSTALIHNHYPGVAETIRAAQGRSSRARRDAKHQELRAEQQKNRALRQAIEGLRTQVRKLASNNERLLAENSMFNAKKDANVVELSSRLGTSVASDVPH